MAVSATAQIARIPPRLSIVSAKDGERSTFEVFKIPHEGYNSFYLSVGALGVGDEVVQIQFDPLFELFIPLGNSADEARANLKMLQELYKSTPGDSIVIQGCLSIALPNEEWEPVKVTYRRILLTNMLEFSVEREECIRSTLVPRPQFNALVSGLDFHKKLFPND